MVRFSFHERITVPLNDNGPVLVSDDFLAFLVKDSTRKFEANFLQLARFREHLALQNSSGDPRGLRIADNEEQNVLFTGKKFKIVSKGLKFKKCGFCRAVPLNVDNEADESEITVFVLLEKKMRKPEDFDHAKRRLRLGQVIE